MFEHIISAFVADPWFITPAKGQAIAGLLAMRARGEKVSAEEVRAIVQIRDAAHAAHPYDVAALHFAASPGGKAPRNVAVLPMYGVLSPRVGGIEESSGMVSTEAWGRKFQSLVDDPTIGAIVLDVDSPGGSVFGIDELASRVAAGAAVKPVYAVANSEADSAAYYVASQATEFAVTPSGVVGSIGVWMAHYDLSAAYEMAGIKTTVIQSGKNKTEGNQFAPLTEDAKAFLQKQSDEYYDMFVKAVARGRGVPVSAVRGEQFGQGRSFIAKEAVSRGMADRVATLEETIARAASGKVVRGMRAGAASYTTFEASTDTGTYVLADGTVQDVVDGHAVETSSEPWHVPADHEAAREVAGWRVRMAEIGS